MKPYSEKDLHQIDQEFDRMIERLEVAKKQFKAFRKGNNSEGTRLKKNLLSIRTINTKVRGEVQRLKDGYPC